MNMFCAYETSEKVCQMQGSGSICTQFNNAFVADIKPPFKFWQNGHLEHQNTFVNANLSNRQQHEHHQNFRKINESCYFTQRNKVNPFSDDKRHIYKDFMNCMGTEKNRLAPAAEIYPRVADVLVSTTSNTYAKKLLHGTDSLPSDNSKNLLSIHIDYSDTETLQQVFNTTDNCTDVNDKLLHPNTAHAITVNEQPLDLRFQLHNNNEETGMSANSSYSHDNAPSTPSGFQMFVTDFDVLSKPSICQLCGYMCANEEILRIHSCRNVTTADCATKKTTIVPNNQTDFRPSDKSRQNDLARRQSYMKPYDCIDKLSSQRSLSNDTQKYTTGTNGNIYESVTTRISSTTTENCTDDVNEVLLQPNTARAITVNEQPLDLHFQLHNNNEETGMSTNSSYSHDNAPSTPSGFQMFVRDFDVLSKPSICQLCGEACSNEEILRIHMCKNTTTADCATKKTAIVPNNQTDLRPSGKSRQNDLARCQSFMKLYDCTGKLSIQRSLSNNTQKYTTGTNKNIHESVTTRISRTTTENFTDVNEVLLQPNTAHAITVNDQHFQVHNNNEEIGLIINSCNSQDNTPSTPSDFHMFVRDFDVLSKPSICQLCGEASANEEILRIHICRNTTTADYATKKNNIVPKNQTDSIPSDKKKQNDLARRQCYVKLYDCIDKLSSQRSVLHDTQNYSTGTNGNIHESVTTRISQTDNDQNTGSADTDPYKCQECNAVFKRKSSLKHHLQIHFQPFKCQKCGDNFSSEFDLQEHCYIHTKEPYECDNCGSLFADLERLQRHSRSHEADNQNYTSADEGAENSSELEAITIQTNKPFHCDTCSASFKTKYHLNRHVVGHSGSKPSKRSDCYKAFSRSDKLQNHILIHHSSYSNENSAHNFVHSKTNVTYTSEFNKENKLHSNHNAIIDCNTTSNVRQLRGNCDRRIIQSSLGSGRILTTGNCGPIFALNPTIQPSSVQPSVASNFDINLLTYTNYISSKCSALRSSTLSTSSSNGVSTEALEIYNAANTPQRTVCNNGNHRSISLSTSSNNGISTEAIEVFHAANTPLQTVLNNGKPSSSILAACSSSEESTEAIEVCHAANTPQQTVLNNGNPSSSTLSACSNNGVSAEALEVCNAVNTPQQTVLNNVHPSSSTLSACSNNGVFAEALEVCNAVNTPQQTVLNNGRPSFSTLSACRNNGVPTEALEVYHAANAPQQTVLNNGTPSSSLLYTSSKYEGSTETTEVCSAVDSSHQTAVSESSSNNRYKCFDCPLQFTQQESFLAHSRIHTDVSLSSIKKHQHKSITSSTEPDVYKCHECGKVLSRKDNLLDHINAVHTNIRPYKCEKCGRCLATKKALSSHISKHLNKPNPVFCKICGKRYATPSCLRLHMRIHTGEKPFKCSQCSAVFARAMSFKIHFRIHSGEKPYKCTKCNAAFTSHKGLSVHSAVHSNKKPYLCEICGTAFPHNQRLLLHRRLSHGGAKPRKCPICEASFTLPANLKRHMHIHTGERPYKCAECGSAFTQKEHLKKHVRTMHD